MYQGKKRTIISCYRGGHQRNYQDKIQLQEMRNLEPELVVLGEDRGQGLADDVLVFHDNKSYSILAVQWNNSTKFINEYTKQYINSGEQLTPWGCGDLASSLLIAWHDTKQQGFTKQGMLHPVA